MERARKFELFMGCLGNGTTVCNKAVMENGDYKKVCHISNEGEITWYVKPGYVPEEALAKIEATAARDKARYDEWFGSLPSSKQYQIRLDKMSTAELIKYLDEKRGNMK